jgi:hypothetical protein
MTIYEMMAKTHMILFSVEFKCGSDGHYKVIFKIEINIHELCVFLFYKPIFFLKQFFINNFVVVVLL